ncbi:MAG: hypothetical protein KatS3mg034_0904 [Vicingaceae bacterium]|jgi:hypothetical protein|nr:MAG: hypothetical protein KatS3mg034_0904 [Vicingaceae bacterium]
MKNLKMLLSIAIFMTMASCGNNQEEENLHEENVVTVDTTYEIFGDSISAEGAIDAYRAIEQLKEKDSVYVKIVSIIDEVCQKKGCWMDLKVNDTSYITVRFVDYSFFVPKDAAGREAVVEGWLKADTLSVEELRHYASDAGQSQEEINNIIKPEISYELMAHGVLIKKP